MNQALILNVCICIVIGICMIVLSNPLALFGLLLLKDMPYGLMMPDSEEKEESKPIGFVQ